MYAAVSERPAKRTVAGQRAVDRAGETRRMQLPGQSGQRVPQQRVRRHRLQRQGVQHPGEDEVVSSGKQKYKRSFHVQVERRGAGQTGRERHQDHGADHDRHPLYPSVCQHQQDFGVIREHFVHSADGNFAGVARLLLRAEVQVHPRQGQTIEATLQRCQEGSIEDPDQTHQIRR